MNIFAHACCAPCLSGVYPQLVEEGHDVTAYWYNPTIHPYTEWQRRTHALERYAYLTGVKVIYEREYKLNPHLYILASMEADGRDRCQYCYAVRLQKTAQKAIEGGFDAFTTTLLVSRHQKHEDIRRIGRQIGKSLGIKFYYEDFRKQWKRSIAESHKYELYRQPYCGCIFSESERYLGQ